MKTLWVFLIIMAFVLLPVTAMAQNYPSGGKAPIAQPLVREGTVAVGMVKALNLGVTSDEVEAENLLVAAGIAPRNGWISDYPVTPDIVSELRAAVNGASDTGSLRLRRSDAMHALDGILAQYNLTLMDDNSGKIADREQAPVYPDDSEMNDYYYNEGPPPVTYYEPPADYANLYTWVPYPFLGWDAWFPGFFVLADFDRFVYDDGHVFVVSNHFFDRDDHRFRRIDADNRFREFHNRVFDEHGRHFVNTRVIGPTNVGKEAEKAFMAEHRSERSGFDHRNANLSERREMRNEGREMNRENRPSVSSTGKRFNFSPGWENPSVSPFERDRGNRWFNFSPGRVGPGRERGFNAPSERPSFAHSGFGMSFEGMRGGFSGGAGGGHGRR